nr:helix-turn-helix transcriptional regulator [Streptomyces ossamyceticus]
MKWGPSDWARLGDVIRKSRERQGYSRKRLSEMSGVSEKSIQLIEEGRVPTRWPKSVDALVGALDWHPGTEKRVLDGLDLDGPFFDNSSTPAGGAGREGDVVVAAPDYRLLDSREIELVQSGHLAQDIFMRQAKRYRKLQGISLEDLAKRLAGKEPVLENEDIRRLENGTRLLRMAEAKAIAFALGTTVDWLLGSGFSHDAPEEMKWPPNDEELQAEAKAVERRLGEIGMQVNAAAGQFAQAMEREEMARQQTTMARAMLQQATSQQREMERHYQYLIGRIDSIRAAKGDELIMQLHPVYEGDEEGDYEKPPPRPAHTPSSSYKAGAQYPGSKA